MDVPSDVFADKHWGQAPLLTQGRPADTYADLFDADAVDALVSTHGLRTPFARMAKGGDVVAPRLFTRSGGAGASIADQLADDKVLALLADGTTLVLQALHRTWPPLVRFAAALSGELGHPVQINAYITPPQNQGFASHYDNHDVFVLQIAGRKQWRIHPPVLTDPLPDEKWEKRRREVAAQAEKAPLLDSVLAPGDALYLPRGYLHSAVALGELSIHLTVGVHAITRHDIVHELLDAITRDPRLRASLPMGVDLADPSVLAPVVAETTRALAEVARDLISARGPDVATAIARRLTDDTRPEPLAPLRQGTLAATLTARTRVRARTGLRYSLTTGALCTLHVLDKTVTLPGAAADALTVVLDGPPFTAGELPGLDDDERLALVRQLLRDGIVVAAEAVA